jgi:hypothetical protein
MTSTWISLGAVILWRNRIRLLLVVAATAFLSGLIHWQWGAVRELTAISLVCTFYFLFGVLCNTESESGRGFSGISSYFFKLPVGTGSIVFAHLLVGFSVILLTSTLWFVLVLRFVDWSVSYLDLIVFLSACFSVFSSLVWGLSRAPRCRLCALAVGFFLMLGLSLGPLGFSSSPASFWREYHLLLLGSLCVVSVFSPLVVLPLISADRSGGALRRFWLADFLFEVVPWRWARHYSGKTPERALLIKEIGRAGWFLPTAMLLLVVFVYGVACWRNYWWGSVQDEVTATLSNALIFVGLVIGAHFQGFLLSNFGRSVWSENRSMTSFQGVLPVSSETMVIAKMKAAMVSLCLSWVIVLLGACFWSWIWEVVPPWLALKGAQYRGFESGGPLPFFILIVLAMILSWRSLTILLWLGLLGRRGALEFGLVSIFAQVAVLISVGTWESRPVHPGFVWMMVSAIWLWLALKVFLCVVALLRLGKSRSKLRSFLLGYGLCWVVGTSFAMGVASWLGRFLGCPSFIVLPLMVCLMPLGSVFASLITGSLNRHRN